MKKMLTTIVITLLSISVSQLFALNQSQKSDNDKSIAIIINSELYPQVKDSVDRYIVDLEKEGHNVIFSEWDNNAHPDIEELKNLLKEYNQNSKIQGAVLIGKLPYASGKIDGEEGPIDTYLMDLKSINFIKNSDGKIIEHVGPIHLDIWVSRIWAPKKSNLFSSDISEVDLIKNYFEKNHLYRTCQSSVPDLKIQFYAHNGRKLHKIAEYLNSWYNFYQYLAETGYPQEYLEFVKNNPAQYLYLSSHSSSSVHSFFSEYSLLSSTSIANGAHIKQHFIYLEACSACRFSDPESLGNAYLFGLHSSALVIVGMTVSGSLRDIIFGHSDGNNFGNSVVSRFDSHWITSLSMYPVKMAAALSISWMSDPVNWINYFTLFTSIPDILEYHALKHNSALRIGFTLLGDPTLKPYINMDWCPKYDDKKDI